MATQYRIFRLPARIGSEEEQELNAFLNAVRVLAVHRDFVSSGEL